MWSQIRMAVSVEGTASAEGKEAFEAAYAARAQVLIESNRLAKIERSDYRRTITELEAAVPAEQIKYLFYEDLFAPQTMMDLCAFLDIDPVIADGKVRSNLGTSAIMPSDIRAAFERASAPQYAFVRERFGEAVPDTWADDRVWRHGVKTITGRLKSPWS